MAALRSAPTVRPRELTTVGAGVSVAIRAQG
jgi:hypothetical protein